MAKAAIVILAAGDTPESLGRVVNAFMVALEYKEAGDEVRVLFDGAGVKAAAACADSGHDYHDLFKKVEDCIQGACQYCAGAFDVKDDLKEKDLPLADEFKDHPSFRTLAEEGFTVFTF